MEKDLNLNLNLNLNLDLVHMTHEETPKLRSSARTAPSVGRGVPICNRPF